MKNSTGALIDTRPIEKKNKDYQFSEIVASTNPVIWQTKSESEWRIFPIFNQFDTNMCVSFTVAKQLGIQSFINEGEYIDFSKAHLYERRSNKPSAGMGSDDGYNIVRKEGITLEQLYPTPSKNNDGKDLRIKKSSNLVGQIFKIDAYLSVERDIDTIASIIQTTGKGVMVWFWGNYKEWNQEVPKILDKTQTLYTAVVRHSVTAVDFFLYKGKKALLIEDSWGIKTGNNGRRIITEDFFNARNYYAGHIMNFKFENDELNISEPKFNITKSVSFGDNNIDVGQLQQMLRYEGLFPVNTQTTTYYGAITAKAVMDWQLKHGVDSPEVIGNLQGRYFGQKSLKKFRQLYM